MATLSTIQWQEDKGLMAKSGPTHFRCCLPPLCPMAPRSLFSKAPAPPDAEGPKRASVSGGGGGRGVRRSRRRSAGLRGRCTRGGVALLASLGVLSDLKKQTPTSETPTALYFYCGLNPSLNVTLYAGGGLGTHG